MTKRQLTRKQIKNIENKKKEQYDTYSSKIRKKGLVISHFGQQVEVEIDIGKTLLCQYRQNLGPIVTGDRVLWMKQENTKQGVVVERLFRKTSLIRTKQKNGKNQVIAANIDQLIIVIAILPEPIEHYIDRYLVAAHHMIINPIIVINKIDLYSQGKDADRIDRIYKLYNSLGYTVIMISAKTKKNLCALKENLVNKTSIFVGQSGVGKSESLNALFNKSIRKTQIISKHNKHGKHTTTHSRLFHLNYNTNIIDSPGTREFGIWHLSNTEILKGFIEIERLQIYCRFKNCQHTQTSKDCAIYRAKEKGIISLQRFNNYHRFIQKSLL